MNGQIAIVLITVVLDRVLVLRIGRFRDAFGLFSKHRVGTDIGLTLMRG